MKAFSLSGIGKPKVKIQLATEDDIASLSGNVHDAEIKDHIVCFRLISLQSTKERRRSRYYIAIGFSDFDPVIVENVIAIRGKHIQTKNGDVYSIEEINQQELPQTLLQHLKNYLK